MNSVEALHKLVIEGDYKGALQLMENDGSLSEYIKSLYSTTINLAQGNYDTALDCAEKSFELSLNSDNPLESEQSRVAMAYAFERMGKMEEVANLLQIAEKNFSKYSIEELGNSLYWFWNMWNLKGGINLDRGLRNVCRFPSS